MRLITDLDGRERGKNCRRRGKGRARRLIMIVQTARMTFLHSQGKQSRYSPFKREFVTQDRYNVIIY